MSVINTRLCVGPQHSQFCPILARFLDYYSLFWGPGEVSTINEPRGAFTIRSSTLAVLADFDPFHDLLLTALWPQTGFIVVGPQGALTYRSSTLTSLADSGPFHGLLLTVLGSWSDFHDYEPWGAFTFWSSTLAVFIDSDPFYGLLLTVSGPQTNFHSC